MGRRGQGWSLAKVTLANERVSLSTGGALWGMGPTVADLTDSVRASGGIGDPLLRQRQAAVWSEGEMLRLLRLRMVAAAIAGGVPGPETSVRKALADEHGQHLMALARDLAGARGMLAEAGPGRRVVARRRLELRLPLRARPHHRRRHGRGAAQHHRRANARASP